MSLDMDPAVVPLDLNHAPLDVIVVVLQSMSYQDRFTCALVCKAWAEAATAATSSIILRRRVQDLSCLQRWLEKHGTHVKVLQLHECAGGTALTALPCPQLHDLLLCRGYDSEPYSEPLGAEFEIDSRVWSDLAAATKLISISLGNVKAAFQQAEVVSALTALPDLEHLTWYGSGRLSGSVLLQKLTKLTGLELRCITTAALEHLSSLTNLQRLSIGAPDDSQFACPGLQELKALTSLDLHSLRDLLPIVSQLTTLQQLALSDAKTTTLHRLHALSGLTYLYVEDLMSDDQGLSIESGPLQLPGLQHLELMGWRDMFMPVSFLANCTKLQVLKLWNIDFKGPGSLVVSTMLQHLEVYQCSAQSSDAAAGPVPWQQMFPGPGQLPHLTFLEFKSVLPDIDHADVEHLVTCCSSLQVLHLETLQSSFASVLARLSGLTHLNGHVDDDKQCSSLSQLTGLRELRLGMTKVSAAAFRQLAALEQLTSLGLSHWRYWIVSPVLEQMSDSLPDCTQAFINKAPAGQPSDVSARLLRACNMMADADRI